MTCAPKRSTSESFRHGVWCAYRKLLVPLDCKIHRYLARSIAKHRSAATIGASCVYSCWDRIPAARRFCNDRIPNTAFACQHHKHIQSIRMLHWVLASYLTNVCGDASRSYHTTLSSQHPLVINIHSFSASTRYQHQHQHQYIQKEEAKHEQVRFWHSHPL
jgi:hypothetical protein